MVWEFNRDEVGANDLSIFVLDDHYTKLTGIKMYKFEEIIIV